MHYRETKMIIATDLHVRSMPHALKISLNYLKMLIYKNLWIPNAVAELPLKEVCFTGQEAFNKHRN